MIANRRTGVIRRDAVRILENRGYGVVPIDCSTAAGLLPIHLLGLKGESELLHVWLKRSIREITSDTAIEAFCADEIRQFRKMVATDPGKIRPRYEIWISQPSGNFCGIEVLPDQLIDIGSYSREPVHPAGAHP
jgi:hypothetical protein